MRKMCPSYIKINSKWITDLNVKGKMFRKNIGDDFQGLGLGKEFLNLTPKAQSV